MPLLDGAEILDFFAAPFEDLARLPDLLLEDFDRGEDFVISLGRGTPPARRPIIHVPAWDEIIHLVPEQLLPDEEQARRRRARAIRIAESPVPESVQAIGSIMTWVDDVQDALLTAAILTRIGAVFYKPLLPIATGLGSLAEAANVFNLAAHLTATPLTGKFRAQSAVKGILGAQVVRGLSNRALQRAIPTVGEAIQVLQTTDQLFGVGLSLGPIMGLFQELIFGIPQGAEFTFGSGIRFRPADDLWLQRSYQDKAEALQLHAPIGRIVGAAPAAAWILGADAGLSFSDHLDALALLTITAELARGFLQESNWHPLILPATTKPRPPSRQIRPRTSLEILRLGRIPAAHETFPIPGNPRSLDVATQAAALLKCGAACVHTWLERAPSREARLFAEQLATDLPYRFIRAFEGPGAGFETHNAPEWRAVIDSLELGLRPPLGAKQETVLNYLTAAADLYRQDPTREIPLRELRALHATAFPRP